MVQLMLRAAPHSAVESRAANPCVTKVTFRSSLFIALAWRLLRLANV
jgi:hypothetical protein